MRQVLVSIGATVSVTLAILVAVELTILGLGWAPPAPVALIIWDVDVDRQLLDSEGTFRLQPNWLWEPRPGAIDQGEAINADAYRGPGVPRERESPLRIATMGDSSTYGMRLPEKVSWSRVLESLLRERGIDAEVLNFGVVGFSAAQGLALYRGKVREFQPDVVVSAFGAINDQFAPPSGLSDRDKIELLGSPSARALSLFRRSAAVRWISGHFAAPSAATGIRKHRVSIPEFEDSLLAIDQQQREDGHAMVLVSPPRRVVSERRLYPAAVAYTEALQRIAESDQIPLADVRARFRTSGRSMNELFIDNNHPNEAGHRLWAAVVVETMSDAGLLRE